MDALIRFLDNLVKSGKLSVEWLLGLGIVASLGVFFYYATKGVTHLMTFFKEQHKSSTPEGIPKAEFDSVTAKLIDNDTTILKILEDVESRLKAIEETSENAIELNLKLENELESLTSIVQDLKEQHDDDSRTTLTIQHDLSNLVSDSKSQYSEISRQVQAVQKDLASLHGTIIGLNTQRSRLK